MVEWSFNIVRSQDKCDWQRFLPNYVRLRIPRELRLSPSDFREGRRRISPLGIGARCISSNVQPTIKVHAGYKFTVRVNRDILFDAPVPADGGEPAPRATSRTV
jgi:hypothetical protein